MGIVVLTGPEKAGKTTLALKILERETRLHVVYAKFRRPGLVDGREYAEVVKLAANPRVLVVVDRGWPDEHVYTSLTGRPSLLADPAWSEWCLGEPARQLGVTALVLPGRRLAPLDPSDFQFEWDAEAQAFRDYCRPYPYLTVDPTLDGTADFVLSKAKAAASASPAPVTEYCGPPSPVVVVVGEARNERSRSPLAFAPMTTPAFVPVARALLGLGVAVGRTNADNLRDRLIAQLTRNAPVVVALGRRAAEAVRAIGRDSFVELHHPSAVARWGKYREERGIYEFLLRQRVLHALRSAGEKEDFSG